MMKFILTQDGSYTLFDNEVEESQHSLTAGAITEAREKHIFPLQLEDGMNILDFCFGLGYNSIIAAFYYKDLNITGLESNIHVLEQIRLLPIPVEWEQAFLPFRNIADLRVAKDKKKNQISICLGDALQTMYKFPTNSFDRIFFDPFSPKKQPELWTKEVFQQMYNLLKPQGKLSTYSCASHVRKKMTEAGFRVMDGPAVGRKAPATIAIKNEEIEQC